MPIPDLVMLLTGCIAIDLIACVEYLINPEGGNDNEAR